MRITENDGIKEAIVKISEGNPGALNVCMQLFQTCPAAILQLDMQEIYGSNIWIAYKDVCGEELEKLKNLLLTGVLKPILEGLPEYQYYKMQQTNSRN